MATTKNITMKQFNGTDYDTLYPKTVYNQVSGVAPAGYGLGGTAKILTDADDLNNIKTTGWYCYHSNKHPANVPTPEVFSAVMEVIFGYYSGQTMQRVYSTGDNNDWNLVAQRVSYGSGGWQPWEWVNPPMNVGVEYRTTERYGGKPVYAKIVSFGANTLGTAGTQTALQYYSSQSDRVSNVVSLFGWNDYKAITLFRDDIWKASANRKSIIVSSITDLTADYGTFLIKYTKSSD